MSLLKQGLRRLWKSFLPKGEQQSRPGPKPSLQIETLEDRTLMTTALGSFITGPNRADYSAYTAAFDSRYLLKEGDYGVGRVTVNSNTGLYWVELGWDSFNYYGTNYKGLGLSFLGDLVFSQYPNNYALTRLTPLHNNSGWVGTELYKQMDLTGDGINDVYIFQWNVYSGTSSVIFQAILQLNTGNQKGDITYQYVDLNTGNPYTSNGVGMSAYMTDGYDPLVLPALPNQWVGDGKAIRITTQKPTPEITVLMGNSNIADGSTAPIDFGSVNQGQNGPTRTFTVRNDGTGTLSLGNVVVPSGFTVVEGLNATLGAGGSDTFTVQLNSTSPGTFSGDISFSNNDGDENPFNFAVKGTVTAVALPEITVQLGTRNLSSGEVIEFGSVAKGLNGPTKTFIVRNDGKATLNLGNVLVTSSFTVIEGLNATLGPGESDTITVQLNTTTEGQKGGSLSIVHNDNTDGENPFIIGLTGTVTGSPLEPIADITIPHSQKTVTVSLPGNYSSLTAQSKDLKALAYELDQKLGLKYYGSTLDNYYGGNEKWFTGLGTQWYCIQSNGEVRRWAGTWGATLQKAGLVATLDGSFHADPNLLGNALFSNPIDVKPIINPVAKQMILNVPEGFAGTILVDATPDGNVAAKQSFRLTVTNAIPVLSAIEDKEVSHTAKSISVFLNASDADQDPLVFTALVKDLKSIAFDLDQKLGLTYAGTTLDNYWKGQEKWFTDRTFQWYCILPTGELHQWVKSWAGTLNPANRVATLDATFHTDPNLLGNAQRGTTFNISPTFSSNQMTLELPGGYAGTFLVEVSASDGIAAAKQDFRLTVKNAAPVLSPMSDQTVLHTQRSLVLPLNASDADNDPLKYSVQITDLKTLAYELDQKLGLSYYGSALDNYYKGYEKWFTGLGTQWYCIQGNGELRRWAGSWAATQQSASLVATLDASFYADPSLLGNAQPGLRTEVYDTLVPPPPSQGVIWVWLQNNQMTVMPPTGYAGGMMVEVSVSDGITTTKQSYRVTVKNSAPVLAPIPDQVVPHTQNSLTLTLNASDADNDPVRFTAQAKDLKALAYELDQKLGLTYHGPADNYYKGNEKWFSGLGNQWYSIQPNGQVRRWAGTWAATQQDANLVATLDASFHANPTLLGNAQPGTALNLSPTFVGNQMTIPLPAGYEGTMVVEVSASDGIAATTQNFRLTVKNSVPVLAPIPDQVVPHTQNTLTLTLNASDADNDPVKFTAQVQDLKALAYELDQKLGLTYYGPALDNYYKGNEKWFSGLGNQWYSIQSNGQVRRWAGTWAATQQDANLVATLDASFHADPTLLGNALPGTALNNSPTFAGNQMIIPLLAGYAGTMLVEVSASDGIAMATQNFRLMVKNTAPVLSPIPDQVVPHTQGSLTLTLNASDADNDPLRFTAHVQDLKALAYELDQKLGLTYYGPALDNYYGGYEKWFTGSGNQWFCILPNGAVHRWVNGWLETMKAANVVAFLDPSYHANPKLLGNPQPAYTPTMDITFAGNQMTITPPAGYGGTFQVEVTATDGMASAKQSFRVEANRLPVLAAIPDQTLSSTDGSLTLTLQSSDADGDVLTYSTHVKDLKTLAYQLDQQYGLSHYPAYDNLYGGNEKWFLAQGNQWYCIMPDGEIHHWVNNWAETKQTVNLLAKLDRSFHSDPHLLANAQPASRPIIDITFSGNQMTIRHPAGYTGTLLIEVLAHDGFSTVSVKFRLVVT